MTDASAAGPVAKPGVTLASFNFVTRAARSSKISSRYILPSSFVAVMAPSMAKAAPAAERGALNHRRR